MQRTGGSERLAPAMERVAEERCGSYFTPRNGRESLVTRRNGPPRCAATDLTLARNGVRPPGRTANPRAQCIIWQYRKAFSARPRPNRSARSRPTSACRPGNNSLYAAPTLTESSSSEVPEEGVESDHAPTSLENALLLFERQPDRDDLPIRNHFLLDRLVAAHLDSDGAWGVTLLQQHKSNR